MTTCHSSSTLPTTALCRASGKDCRRNPAIRRTKHRNFPRSVGRGGSLPPVRIVPGEGVPNLRCAAIGAHPFLGASAQRHDCHNANSKTQGGQHG